MIRPSLQELECVSDPSKNINVKYPTNQNLLTPQHKAL